MLRNYSWHIVRRGQVDPHQDQWWTDVDVSSSATAALSGVWEGWQENMLHLPF